MDRKNIRDRVEEVRLQNSKGLQSPLHWLCAHDVLETGTGECLGGRGGRWLVVWKLFGKKVFQTPCLEWVLRCFEFFECCESVF